MTQMSPPQALPAQDAPAQATAPILSPAPSLDRAHILDATAVVLRAHGYDGTTIRRIAEQLNCAVGSIYRYFRDKRELLDGVCQRRFEAVAQHAELGMGVARCASLYARTVADQPDLYRLMFWLASVEQEQAKTGQALPKVVARIVAAWGPQFEMPGSANRFWAQLHGTMMEGQSHDAAMQALGLVAAQEQTATLPAEVMEAASAVLV